MLDLTGNLQPKAATPAYIRETDTAKFEQDVLAGSMQKPVIVDFWAPWCGPCKQMMPAIEKVVTEANGAVDLIKINIDKYPELAEAFRVQSIPAVFAFFQGQPVDGFMGGRSEKDLRAFVDKVLKTAGVERAGGDAPAIDPEALKKLLEAGQLFFRDGKYDDAMATYSTILDADAKNVDALAGLGWCFVGQKDYETLTEYLANLEPEEQAAPRLKGLAFLLEQAKDGDGFDAAVLQAKIEANPKDLEARYNLARAAIAAADLAAAIDSLVELTRRDREWQEQKGRQLLVSLFDAMGPQHPLTAPGRRKLSTVLFS
ncbi:MAG: tetratricopeptide repeat protein [Micavibrio sp.]|nr:tetratricopeptide repeat protein [Micavibrio sp.]